MLVKSWVKYTLFGGPGTRCRNIDRGLLKGLRFNIDTAHKSLRLLGLDESELTAHVRRLAADAAGAMDIGANDGWYTAYFASRPNIGRVWSFDPDAATLELARANVALNSEEFARKTTFLAKFVGNADDDKFCRVDTLAADFTGPLLLKIDVDGGERDVLAGAEKTLGRDNVRLVVETHSAELEQSCTAFLASLGYKIQIIPNAWYRVIVPEARHIPHNRWFIATK
ncbi:MAG: FkbM family methyltransferase [Tepidisphaeraceae bacterium]|jgi:hypothetical protein